MNKINLITMIALLAFVLAWPVYAALEPGRMASAQQQARQRSLAEGAVMYVDHCAQCHGAAGEGLGVMPALNNPALAGANADFLFKTIARAGHGATMAAWHVDEGGILGDFQIEELVTLIQYANWQTVEQIALASGYTEPAAPAHESGVAYLESEDQEDPHTCFACHEEPAMHLGQFGINCARCHNTMTWTPAQLTKHIFLLDHGGKGKVACETCHAENYYEHTCYGCHDHTPEQMQQVHNDEKIYEFETCIDCHPTGAEGEAEQMMQNQVSQGNTLPTMRSVLLDLEGNK